MNKYCDYKICYVIKSRNVFRLKLNIYEGDITTELEMRMGEMVPVTRYRRTAQIAKRKPTFTADIPAAILEDVNKPILETPVEYIKTRGEIKQMCNHLLKEYVPRIPIPEQTNP